MIYYRCVFPAGVGDNEHTLYVAFKTYAQSQGWKLGDQQKLLGNNSLRLNADKQEEQIKEEADRLQAGDHLVVPTLATISTRPSVQEKIVRSLIAKGVMVHVLNLNGSVAGHWVGLQEGWNSAKQFEFETDARIKRAEAQLATVEAEQKDFRKKLIHKMADAFGGEKIVARLEI